jgi:hypothetical protein
MIEENPMKRILAVVGMVALFGGAALAGTDAGCGLGSVVFKGQKGMGPQILAATTNASFGSQSFGITSGTSNCNADSVVKNDVEQKVFVAANLDNLSQEMAQGQGQYVSALAGLMGCPTAAQGEFAKLSQEKYGTLFPSSDVKAEAVLAGLKLEMGRHPWLAAACTRIA